MTDVSERIDECLRPLMHRTADGELVLPVSGDNSPSALLLVARAEIERLRSDCTKLDDMISHKDILLAARDAEIERLRAELSDVTKELHQMEGSAEIVVEQRDDRETAAKVIHDIARHIIPESARHWRERWHWLEDGE